MTMSITTIPITIPGLRCVGVYVNGTHVGYITHRRQEQAPPRFYIADPEWGPVGERAGYSARQDAIEVLVAERGTYRDH
jgi:hypothetical protein